MTTSARPLGQDRTAATKVETGPLRPTGPRPGERIAGLDGLRALAIVGVLVYHLDAAWLPGGFLGVDVFFVVSGFLITTLLVREHRRTGRVALSQFWVRRARRLLPALVLCVVTSVLIARIVSADLLVEVGRQMFGALTFSTNWLEITAGSSYFDQTAPQLFMNFWSLAVEEQFYIVWPLVTIGLLALSSRVRVGAALSIGFVSALLMALLYVPETDATRVYYGTDTHLVGLMVGAGLAFAWASPRLALFVTPSRWGRFGWIAGPARRRGAARGDGPARRAARPHLPWRHRARLRRNGRGDHGRHRPTARRPQVERRRSSGWHDTRCRRGWVRAPTRSTSGTGR